MVKKRDILNKIILSCGHGLGKGEAAFRREINYQQRNPYEHSQTKELADSYLCTDGKW